ncbi:uncharacterized protein BP5553_07849 [Venustampulla echinocandica]|uniref:Uncharacterized protein n=1 Tax=Venustampulla echinocandica TaxID=2656787 RepID=A0A370THP5_9HELO|nr:uncharacterized protein BP5553_07849 [Venustampulla echinocandica]RDL34721.1 hypothetical protein BP5553_07849 [Venustampulla echinocandica]
MPIRRPPLLTWRNQQPRRYLNIEIIRKIHVSKQPPNSRFAVGTFEEPGDTTLKSGDTIPELGDSFPESGKEGKVDVFELDEPDDNDPNA